ncbi:MAG TPA: NAD-dependent epimerase/dehydratase family protein [Candidatus Binatia bacterium]|nr:NAD-dependent epimerase/dehydratase family protein [Candidatus Binatia bacterium]
MKRALVTGADGFIGARLVARLAGAGVAVRALVRRGLLRRAEAHVERVRGDVTDPTSLDEAARGCDVVFHCAWGGTTLAEARAINVEGTVNVVDAAARAGARRVVHLSTMSVHGRRLPAVLTEDCPLVFRGDAYGVSKAEGERAAFARGAAGGVEVVALRPTLVYGPRAPFWLVGYFQRVRSEQVALIDGGRGLANLIFVEDVVDALLAAAGTPGVAGEAFLVSGAEPVAWREYLGAFATMCGKPPPPSVPLWRARLAVQALRVYGTLTQRPRRLVGMDLQLMPMRTTVSIERATTRLGWRPATSFPEGMRRCAAWLRAEGYLPRGAAAPETAAPGRRWSVGR